VTSAPAPLAEQGDAELLAHCRRGGQAAWAVLVRRYQALIYTVPRRAGLPEAAAADVFQFVFAQLFQHLDRIDEPERLRAWLVTTAKRETLRLLAQVQREARAEPAPTAAGEEAEDPLAAVADPGPLPEALLDDLQQQAALRAAVARLDERSRRFVELVFLQDEALPYSEVALRLGIAEGSIGPTRARCLAKLRKLMDAP
jgi:RNA polymerase sigma factor (sigma-70 family)